MLWKASWSLGRADSASGTMIESRQEHWTRVKALSRRFANAWSNEYDDLRPVADLVARLQENISRWLNRAPAGWTREPKSQEERDAALAFVRKIVFDALHDLAEERLSDEHRPDWQTAYEFSGRGSGHRRAEEIDRIYEEATPAISSAMSGPARQFMHNLHRIVRPGLFEAAGGQFEKDCRLAACRTEVCQVRPGRGGGAAFMGSGLGSGPVGLRRWAAPWSGGGEDEHPPHVPGQGDQVPLAFGLGEAAQGELAKAHHRFDDAEHRLRRLLAQGVELPGLPALPVDAPSPRAASGPAARAARRRTALARSDDGARAPARSTARSWPRRRPPRWPR